MTDKPTDSEMIAFLDRCVEILKIDSAAVIVQEVELSIVEAIRDRLASLMLTGNHSGDANTMVKPTKDADGLRKILARITEKLQANRYILDIGEISSEGEDIIFEELHRLDYAAEQRGYERGKSEAVPDGWQVVSNLHLQMPELQK